MQPLISPVDHESRQNSYRAEATSTAEEATPLLHRFPRPNLRRHPMTSGAVIGILLVILISGIAIGIYLLILQSQAENILPPVNTPLKLTSIHQWDPSAVSALELTSTPFKTSRVILVQTDTESCFTIKACAQLLLTKKAEATGENKTLPYNFLVSSEGQTFEALGWHSTSPLFPTLQPAIVLAFIGNFTESTPSEAQVAEGKAFFFDSVSRQYLDPEFTIVGKKTKYFPKCLFQSFKDMSQWSDQLSDSSK